MHLRVYGLTRKRYTRALNMRVIARVSDEKADKAMRHMGLLSLLQVLTFD